jgi:hypothetical protein
LEEKKIPGNRGYLLSGTAPQSSFHITVRPLSSSPLSQKVPANRPVERDQEHFLETERHGAVATNRSESAWKRPG